MLVLELPLSFGNFELSSVDLLRRGVLPEQVWVYFCHIPCVRGCGRVVFYTPWLYATLRGVCHEALMGGVVTPGIGGRVIDLHVEDVVQGLVIVV